jgi:hypothetical protein
MHMASNLDQFIVHIVTKHHSVHRIMVLALSYDEDEQNILYTTKYVTFINLLDGS